MTEPLRHMDINTVAEVGRLFNYDTGDPETSIEQGSLGSWLMDEMGVNPESFEAFMTMIFKGFKGTQHPMLGDYSEVQAASSAFTTMFAAGVLMERKRREAAGEQTRSGS